MEISPSDLLQMRTFDEFKLGYYLGSEEGAEAETIANSRACEFLQFVNLIPHETTTFFCNKIINVNGTNYKCGAQMSIRNCNNRRLGFRLICKGTASIHGRHSIYQPSPLIGTILEKSKIEFRFFMKILYYFMTNRDLKDLSSKSGLCEKTVIQWFSYLREAVMVVAWHEFNKIGGYGDVVEIDESLLFHRKNNVGRIPTEIWTFGGISRTTNQMFAVHVENRNSFILNEEILDCISPGTYICSDGWAAYHNISNLPNEVSPRHYRGHGVVIHQENFIFPPRGEDPLWVTGFNPECYDGKFIGPSPIPDHSPFRIHTQKIESTWKYLKKFIHTNRDLDSVNKYIGEFMYKRNILDKIDGQANKFQRLCRDITDVYPGLMREQIKANKPDFRRTLINNRTVDFCKCRKCI